MIAALHLINVLYKAHPRIQIPSFSDSSSRDTLRDGPVGSLITVDIVMKAYPWQILQVQHLAHIIQWCEPAISGHADQEECSKRKI